MSTARFIKLAANPRAYAAMARSAVRRHYPCRDDAVHLQATMDWLLSAWRATGSDGVSAWYCLGEGWHPAYPETTGYIIPTCLAYAERFGREDLAAAAAAMGRWTLTRQKGDGGVVGGTDPGAGPVVFNTGQCMLGWQALAGRAVGGGYREALRRAADWLVEIQDADGCWSRHVYRGVPHAYHTRVAWPLFLAGALLGVERYHEAARRNVAWCLGHTRENHWIDGMAFYPGETALTHTIAYTYRGLLECLPFLEGELRTRAAAVAAGAAERLMHVFERRKVSPYGLPRPMPATFDERWRATAAYSCVTGNAQVAILWLKHFTATGDWRFVNAALKLLDQIKEVQDVQARHDGMRGGIPSSNPIYGSYLPMRYLNWAAKFFADALMLQQGVMAEIER